jgi:hypothetical protein
MLKVLLRRRQTEIANDIDPLRAGIKRVRVVGLNREAIRASILEHCDESQIPAAERKPI